MLLLLDRRIKILFIIVSLFIFKGCGVSDSITSEYYNKTFGEREEIECPEIKIIKELGELYKENKSEELNYLVGIIIIHNGKIVSENYYNGSSISEVYNIWSVT